MATQIFLEFSPRSLGKIPILTDIFQTGWFNHQLVWYLFDTYLRPFALLQTTQRDILVHWLENPTLIPFQTDFHVQFKNQPKPKNHQHFSSKDATKKQTKMMFLQKKTSNKTSLFGVGFGKRWTHGFVFVCFKLRHRWSQKLLRLHSVRGADLGAFDVKAGRVAGS